MFFGLPSMEREKPNCVSEHIGIRIHCTSKEHMKIFKSPCSSTLSRQILHFRYIVIHSMVSNGSENGQRKPRSDCAYAQSDLGLRCPHMAKAGFPVSRPNITLQVSSGLKYAKVFFF